eukprot:GILK01009761.1.p1 GENE.GILK01009761.1~~GILK01009761.1.p1  ORF type:complete len:735 (+),score=145.25 GILK01009761.1:27-2231(+)
MGNDSSSQGKVTSEGGARDELDAAVSLATDQNLTSRLELSISCTDLPNMDVLSKSDPMVVMSMRDSRGNWVETARTEIIHDTLNPKFVKSFTVDYYFESQQWIKFDVYDIDDFSNNAPLSAQDFIGSTTLVLHEVVNSPSQTIKKQLSNATHSDRGILIVSAEELRNLHHKVNMQLTVTHPKKKGCFVVFSRSKESGGAVPIYRTEVNKKSDIATWEPVSLTVERLCRGDDQRPINIELFQWHRSGSHVLLGATSCTLNQLLNTPNLSLPLVLSNHTSGQTLCFHRVSMSAQSSFLDYIFGGCEIALITAIDFTRSNGVPTDFNSLHYLRPGVGSEYSRAVQAVGDVLKYYDSDNKIPVYGFGARLPPSYENVSHCFALNGNYFAPEVLGIEGVQQAYQNALSTVSLHGPTVFAPIIHLAAQFASETISQYSQKYFILLMITDGIINDMDATINEIVAASALPLSIIIVGVGAEDFSLMERLDADTEPLYSPKLGKYMERDIVQFVPFRNFANKPLQELAKEVLYEVPGQLVSFFSSKNIQPNPPRRTVEPFATDDAGPLFLQQEQQMLTSQLVNLGVPDQLIVQAAERGFPTREINHCLEMVNLVAQPNHVSNRPPPMGMLPRQGSFQTNNGFQQPSQQSAYAMRAQTVPTLATAPPAFNSTAAAASTTAAPSDGNTCKICFERAINTVLLECGHQVACSVCADALLNSSNANNKICPVCRAPISRVVRTFSS